jgi:hypothetical protein
VPFAVDAASYLCSLVSIVLMRTPFQEGARARDGAAVGPGRRGLRFVWARQFPRTVALIFSLLNAVGLGILLALVVVRRADGARRPDPGRHGRRCTTSNPCSDARRSVTSER